MAVCLVAAAAGACDGRRGGQAAHHEADLPPPKDLPEARPERAAKESSHPRILFTPATVKRLRAAARAGSPMWRQLEPRCRIYRDESDKSGGYLGLQWGDAIGSLVTCYFATGDKTYRDRALVYVRAILNDKQKVGDGEGGDKVVRGNSGYPIRSYGVYAALAYDWLHDEPGMDELRPLILERLDAWLGWYMESGYLNDSVYSNYFWGYYTTLAMAGLASDGEAEQSAGWLEKTHSLLEGKIIPGFHANLKGGEWAEGWQYGQLVAMEVALLVDAFHTATGADYSKRFPWLTEIVDAYLHRMRPDRTSVYGNGTQAVMPPPPEPSGLASVLLVLDWSNPDAAARGRFLVRRLSPKMSNERLWFAFVADRPEGKEVDPRSPKVLGYHLAGPGQTFVRSSWKDSAVWVAFQAGPRVAIDHQHNDQGHFEMWRGRDALISDFGDESAYATINHNSILIDDGGKVIRYSPNQSIYGKKSRTIRWHDSGTAAVMVGDITDSWDPKCVLNGCSDRAVTKVIRTLVYVRPNVLVTDDQVELTEDGTGVTWEAHVRTAPEVTGSRATAVVGGSRVDMYAIAPDGAAMRALKEPTTKDDHIYKANVPDGDVWRIEFDTPRGSESRRMRAWVRAANAGAAPDQVLAVRGKGLSGAVGAVETARVAVLFADKEDGGEATVGGGAIGRALVVGLTPGQSYRATAEAGCRIQVVRDASGSVKADPSGTIEVDTSRCAR
ncbi:MAG TPA: heparinase II/III family protein [Kofleriaceae bacterium]|nr:heparinase II/III family protein [Kofleriaceae bacterium]